MCDPGICTQCAQRRDLRRSGLALRAALREGLNFWSVHCGSLWIKPASGSLPEKGGLAGPRTIRAGQVEVGVGGSRTTKF